MTMTKWVTVAALAVLVRLAPVSHASDRAATAAVTLSARNLQVVAADQDVRSTRRWVVWDHGFGVGQSVEAALCRTDDTCSWRTSWPGGYLPTVTEVTAWETGSRSVFLVTFRFGAGAQEADVFGIEPDRRPRLLDRRLEPSLALTPDGLQLGVGSPVRCLSWSGRALRLVSAACRR